MHDDITIGLAEEQAQVGRMAHETGRVRVHVATTTHTHALEIDLDDVSADVTRVPVGTFVDAMPVQREEGDVTVIPIVEERAVVTVRLYLREELHIRRQTTTTAVTRSVALRREHATVERIPTTQQS